MKTYIILKYNEVIISDTGVLRTFGMLKDEFMGTDGHPAL